MNDYKKNNMQAIKLKLLLVAFILILILFPLYYCDIFGGILGMIVEFLVWGLIFFCIVFSINILKYPKVIYAFSPRVYSLNIRNYSSFYDKIVDILKRRKYTNFIDFYYKDTKITFCKTKNKKFVDRYSKWSQYTCCICYHSNVSNEVLDYILDCYFQYIKQIRSKQLTLHLNIIICTNKCNDFLKETLQHYVLYGHRQDGIVSVISFDDNKIFLPSALAYLNEFKKIFSLLYNNSKLIKARK